MLSIQGAEPHSYIEKIIKNIKSFDEIEDAYNSTIKSSDNPDMIDGKEIREAIAIKRFLEDRYITTLMAVDVFMHSIDNKKGHFKPLFLPAEIVSVLYMQYEYSKMILNAKRTEELFGVTEDDDIFEKNFKDIFLKLFCEIFYAESPDKIKFLVYYPYNLDDVFETMNENVGENNSIYMLDLVLQYLQNKYNEVKDEKSKKEISSHIANFEYSLKQLKADTIQVSDLLSEFRG